MEPTTTIYTTAPQAYDYAYCDSQPEPYVNRKGDRLRRVTMPADNANYQIGRYRSGMYEAMTPADFTEWIDLYTPTN